VGVFQNPASDSNDLKSRSNVPADKILRIRRIRRRNYTLMVLHLLSNSAGFEAKR